MEQLIETLKESKTVWVWTDEDIWWHLTRESTGHTWDGRTDEEIAEILHERYSVCVWTFSPLVQGRQEVLEFEYWGDEEDETN